MDFGVLGPFRTSRDGRPWEITAAKYRVLLAALVVHANEVVPVARLVDVLWGTAVPNRPKATLQTYVTRLRRILAEAGSDATIEYDRSGYRLAVDPDRIDLTRFSALVDAADLAAGRADTGSEARHLREALDLWRGEPLADVDSEVLQREVVPQLAERRLHVLRRQLDLELLQGRHAEMLPELVALTERYPLEEHLAQLLMLALHRSGRRVEALETYRRLSARLAEEVGIDPGAELQELHGALLTDTVPVPDSPAPASERVPERAGWLGQCWLPLDVAELVGRDHAVAELVARLRSGGSVPVPIVTISGGPGIGKTALAVRVAHQLRTDYPDGQWYVRLDGAGTRPRQPGQVLYELLRTVGVDSADIPDNVAERAGLLRSRLTDRRLLMLLDDAADASQVQPLLPGTPGNAVLVTSRSALGGLTTLAGAQPHALHLLAAGDAVELLARLVGRDRTGAEPAAVSELARLCGGLPLALRIAAANLADQPGTGIAGYVAELRAAGPLALSAPGDPQVAVRPAFDLSYQSLRAEQQRAFRLLGLPPAVEISPAAAAALWAVPGTRAGTILDTLATANLIERAPEHRFRLHDLIWQYARERAGADEFTAARRPAMRRLLAWYLGTARAASAALGHAHLPLPDDPEPLGTAATFGTAGAAMAWLDTERDAIVLAIEHAAEHGLAPYAWHLAESIRPYLLQRNHLDACERSASAALRAAGERPAVTAALHLSRGTASYLAGRLEQARDRWSVALRRAELAEQPEVRAKIMINLGFVHLELGELAAAEERVTQAGRYGIHQPDLRAGLSNALGVISLERGRLHEARQRFVEAIASACRAGSQRIEMSARGNLAEVALELGNYRQGTEELRATLRLCRLRADPAEAPTLTGLSRAYRLTGELAGAEQTATAALALARDSGQRRYEVDALVELGHLARDQRQPSPSLERFALARDLAGRLSYRRAVAESHAGSALACVASRALADGRRHAEQGYALARSRDLRLLEARLLVVLARIASEDGDLAGAAEHARAAVALYTRMGARAGVADALVELGTADPAEADRHWRRALDVYEHIGSPLATETRLRLDTRATRARPEVAGTGMAP